MSPPTTTLMSGKINKLVQRLRGVSREQVYAVGIAQFLSFLLCITGITSGVLASKGINAPATQSLLNYALLAVTCTVMHVRHHKWRWHTSNPWYTYLVLAFLDVQGNFLVTKAYQFTSITSVTLLDCFTIPAVMLLSWGVFRARYSPSHLAGAALCVLGLTVLVVTDQQSETGGSRPLLGDALVILGACVYAVCNVSQERLLVNTSQWEVLSMVGCWGTVLAGTQALILERDAWVNATWDGRAIGAMIGFAGALYMFYVLVPRVLTWGGSTVLNLSLLTSDLWAAGARAVLFGGFGGTGIYFAMAMVAETAGIFLYTLAGDAYTSKAGEGAHEGRGSTACLPVSLSPRADVEGQEEEEEEEEEREELGPWPLGRGGAGGGAGNVEERQRLLVSSPSVDGVSNGSGDGSPGGTWGVRMSEDKVWLMATDAQQQQLQQQNH